MLKKTKKKINWFIGYRTRKSMKNKKMWKLAHQYCSKLWIYIGIITLFISIILYILFYLKILILTELIILIIIFSQVIIMALSIFIIENKLKKFN